MKKAILTLLLAAMSTGAMAEWVRAGGGLGEPNYADPSTIHKYGDKVRMWILTDYEKPLIASGVAYWSLKSLYEYDCANKQMKMVRITGHTQPMGKGAPGGSEEGFHPPKPIDPESVGEVNWKIACGKTKRK